LYNILPADLEEQLKFFRTAEPGLPFLTLLNISGTFSKDEFVKFILQARPNVYNFDSMSAKKLLRGESEKKRFLSIISAEDFKELKQVFTCLDTFGKGRVPF